VIIKGQAVRSCVTAVGPLDGSEITTLEGLGSVDNPHPLQQAFIDEQAMQCGFCINGVIMTAKALLDRTPNPSDGQIRQAMATVLCRCGAHQRMFRAIKRYAQQRAAGRTA
jgi:nicotinate dehydrogenase subunit A